MREGFASAYAELTRTHWWFRGRERILAAVLMRELERLEAHPMPERRLRVLSVGCGPPAALGWLSRALGERASVWGLDADPSRALRRAVAAEPSARERGPAFVWGCLEQPPLRAGACDAVLALDVLEHVDDDVGALRQVGRLVRSGGFALVTVPALPSLWGNQDVVSDHRRRYTAGSLSELFRRAELHVAWQSYFNTALFPAIAAVRWGRRLAGRVGDGPSDFDYDAPGWLDELLARVFAAERHLLGRVRLPIGVSLLAVARPAAGSLQDPASPPAR